MHAMLSKNFRVLLEDFLAVHAGIPGPGAQEYDNVGLIEGLSLLLYAEDLDAEDAQVATVLQFHLHDFEVRNFFLNLNQSQHDFDILPEDVRGAKGVVEAVSYVACSPCDTDD